MFKVVAMMKRKPGMSHREFRDYYEKYHAPMGDIEYSGEDDRSFRLNVTDYSG